MTFNIIYDRVDINEIEGAFGVRFSIKIVEDTRSFGLRVCKGDFYSIRYMTEAEILDMSNEDLKRTIINLARDVFDRYISSLL